MNREKKVEAILAIVVGFLALYFIFGVWKGFQVDWMLWVCLVVGVLSMMSDTVMNLITSAWFKFAEILGNYVTGPILLGLVFFVVLFPISVLARIFGPDNLMKKRREDSYYVDRDHAYETKDIENIW
jgi:hypothetical protein